MAFKTKEFAINLLFTKPKSGWTTKHQTNEEGFNLLFDSYRHFFGLLTCFGIFPVSVDRKRNFKIDVWSLRFVYCVSFLSALVLLSIFISWNVYNNFLILIFKKNSKLDTLYFYAFSINFSGVLILDIMTFFEANKMVNYLRDWANYQNRFEKLTKHQMPKMPRGKKKIITLSLTFIILFAIFMTFLLQRLDQIIEDNHFDRGFHTLVYFTIGFGCIMISIHSFYWLILTRVVRHASDVLLQEIESLRWKRSGCIEQYVMLWHNLRQQCVQLGTVLSCSYLYLFALVFAVSIPCIYIGVQGNISQIIGAINSVAFLTIIAEIAHRTSNKVGEAFQDRLTRLALSGRAVGHEKALMAFAQTIVFNPPTITLGHYFTLDRGINIPLISSVVTYFIVMLQFKVELA